MKPYTYKDPWEGMTAFDGDGEVHLPIDWDTEQRYFPPQKRFQDDEEGMRSFREVPEDADIKLFSDPNDEVVGQWLEACRSDDE